MNIKKFTICAGVLLAVLFCAPAAGVEQTVKNTVKIGVIMPLTGGAANRGADIAQLLDIIEPHFSSQSTKFRYKFVLDDGKCGAGNASTTIAKKLIHVDKVKFLITGCSGEHLQAAPIAQRQGVIAFSMGGTHPDLKEVGDFSFRTAIDVEKGIKDLSKYIIANGKKRIAILTEENSFTFAIRDLLQKHLGDAAVYVEDFSPGERDFNTLLAKVKARKPDGLYFNTMSEDTLTSLVNKARALGLQQQIYSFFLPAAPSFRKTAGANVDGMEFLDNPEIERSSPEYQQIEAEFLKIKPEGPVVEYFMRATFDSAKSIVDAVETVGPDAVKVKEFLKTYRSFGALGPLEYDKHGDLKNINYVVKKIRGDKIVVLR